MLQGGKATKNAGKGRKIPLDILVSSLTALLALAALVVADLAIETDATDNPDVYFPPTEPVFEYIEEETASVDGWTDEGSSNDIDLGRLPLNVTAMRAELTWQDDYGNNDVLKVAVLLNGSEYDSVEDTSGSIELEVAGADFNGTYGVKVSAVSCPGVVDIVPVDRDTGNDWSLKVYITIRREVV